MGIPINRNSLASLAIALTGPPIFYCLWSLINQIWTRVPEAANAFAGVTIFILCPLAAIFFGHVARKQIRRETPDKSGGYTLAGAGLGLGYFEITIVMLIFFAIVHHQPQTEMYESAAVGSMRKINLAARSYAEIHPREGFPGTLKDMESDKDWSIGAALAGGVKSEYRFTYAAKRAKENGTIEAYQVFADPVDSGNKDMRHFFTDQTQTIRYSRGGPANESSAELK